MTDHRKRTKPWYGTARWKRLREQCLQEAGYRCQMCLTRGIVSIASVADHIEPHKGDEAKFWAGPFQSLCAHCHNSHKQSEERTGRKRLTIGEDGWPT